MVIVIEDGVGENVAAQIFPDVLDRIEFGRIGRQPQQSDVFRDFQLSGDMEASTVEHEDGMSAWRHFVPDVGQVQRDRSGIEARQDERGSSAAGRAYRTQNIGPVAPLIARRARSGAPLRPQPGQGALLADPRLVLEPDLDRLAARPLRQNFGYLGGEVFLKAAWASTSALGLCGRTDSRR